MILKGFYTLWTYLRWIAIAISIVLFVGITVYCNSWSLEVEYVGPGSDADKLSHDTKDRDNKDSFDRVQEGKGDSRDQEKANEYSHDHAV